MKKAPAGERVDQSGGGRLFIVDNSVSGWTGLGYLQAWCEIARSFDIATGYFEIGALLELDGKWQGLDNLRILMGAETTHRTWDALLAAVRTRLRDRLDASLEEVKRPNPFLRNVPAILDALRAGKIGELHTSLRVEPSEFHGHDDSAFDMEATMASRFRLSSLFRTLPRSLMNPCFQFSARSP